MKDEEKYEIDEDMEQEKQEKKMTGRGNVESERDKVEIGQKGEEQEKRGETDGIRKEGKGK